MYLQHTADGRVKLCRDLAKYHNRTKKDGTTEIIFDRRPSKRELESAETLHAMMEYLGFYIRPADCFIRRQIA